MTIEKIYEREVKWSKKTFGPGLRTKGTLDHIRKECLEVEADPFDLEEWIDLMFLSFDGASRCVRSQYPKINDKDIVGVVFSAYNQKLKKNINREWPDWRTADPDKAIEHKK